MATAGPIDACVRADGAADRAAGRDARPASCRTKTPQSLVFDDIQPVRAATSSPALTGSRAATRLNAGVHYVGTFANGVLARRRCSASPISSPARTRSPVQDIADAGNYSGLRDGRFRLCRAPRGRYGSRTTRIAARGRFDQNDFTVQRGEVDATDGDRRGHRVGRPISTCARIRTPQIDSPTAAISGDASVNILENWRLFGSARLRHHERPAGSRQRRHRLRQQLPDLLARLQRDRAMNSPISPNSRNCHVQRCCCARSARPASRPTSPISGRATARTPARNRSAHASLFRPIFRLEARLASLAPSTRPSHDWTTSPPGCAGAMRNKDMPAPPFASSLALLVGSVAAAGGVVAHWPTARSRCSSTTSRSPATTLRSAPSSWRSPARRAASRRRLDQLIDEVVEMSRGEEARHRRLRRARRRGLRLDRQEPEDDAGAADQGLAGRRGLARNAEAPHPGPDGLAADRAGEVALRGRRSSPRTSPARSWPTGSPDEQDRRPSSRSSRSFSSCRRARRPAMSRSDGARRRRSASASPAATRASSWPRA